MPSRSPDRGSEGRAVSADRRRYERDLDPTASDTVASYQVLRRCATPIRMAMARARQSLR